MAGHWTIVNGEKVWDFGIDRLSQIRSKSFSMDTQREMFAEDLLQPLTPEGKINQEFVDRYGEEDLPNYNPVDLRESGIDRDALEYRLRK